MRWLFSRIHLRRRSWRRSGALVEESEDSGLTVPEFMKEFLREHLGPEETAP